ncbi:MAG: helix-turn-helix domain-containing protein, partial [Deltaproteobacteria bacterium]
HLIRYDWPGNVRELMNAVERGVVLSRSEYLDDQQLPMLPASPALQPSVFMNPSAITETLSLTAVEKSTILSALASADGNKSLASRKLGITRKTLHKKLKEYGVMP